MKFGTNIISINPEKPVKQAGFIQQVDPISEVHDDLNVRVIIFDDVDMIVMVSMDNIGGSLEFQDNIETEISNHFGKKVNLVISATHTHFGGTPYDDDYRNFLYQKIIEAIISVQLSEFDDLSYTYQYEAFNEVGKSRISKQETDLIFIELVSIYGNQNRLANLMIYNCHPTIMSGAETHFFSGEYPGYAMNKLSDTYQGEFFTFMQGADGDVSTRFTRKSQDYDGVIDLGNKFVTKIEEFMKNDLVLKPIKISFEKEVLPLVHEVIDLETLEIPDDLDARELETIEYGKLAREKVLENIDELPKSIVISRISFGDYHMIFAPNELFSYYLNAIDKEKASLVCYSNGYGRYVTGMEGQRITYELFTDTYTMDTKKAMFDLLKKMSQ